MNSMYEQKVKVSETFKLHILWFLLCIWSKWWNRLSWKLTLASNVFIVLSGITRLTVLANVQVVVPYAWLTHLRWLRKPKCCGRAWEVPLDSWNWCEQISHRLQSCPCLASHSPFWAVSVYGQESASCSYGRLPRLWIPISHPTVVS